MKKSVIVISLGGSQIISDKVNYEYLKEFKKTITKHKRKYSFVIVCGGGSLARNYIDAIKKNKGNILKQSLSGIAATRINARFISYFFGYEQKRGIPHRIGTLKKYLKKEGIVFCGALKYKSDQTSDSTAANIAKKLNASFINLTNVKGLYTKDPKKYKDAKFIKNISWENFDKIIQKIKFKPGQHFVLDQKASKIIQKNKIPTYIIKDVKELNNLLNGKKFKGTLISN